MVREEDLLDSTTTAAKESTTTTATTAAGGGMGDASLMEADADFNIPMLSQRQGTVITKRHEQLQRWNESDTNKMLAKARQPDKRKVKFPEGCVFMAACASGDEGEVDDLLHAGADINTTNVDGLTALHQAVIDENLEMVQFLLDSGAEVDAQDNEGWTALHAAVSCAYVDIVQCLLDQNASLTISNNDGELPVDLIEEGYESESAKIKSILNEEIIKRNVSLDDAREMERKKMLADATEWYKAGRVSDVPHPRTGASALHVAAAKGYIEIINLLLKSGMDINVRDADGWTPLHAAVHWGQTAVAQVLAENMADFGLKSYGGQTVMDVAEEGMLDELKMLEMKSNELRMKQQQHELQQRKQRNGSSSEQLNQQPPPPKTGAKKQSSSDAGTEGSPAKKPANSYPTSATSSSSAVVSSTSASAVTNVSVEPPSSSTPTPSLSVVSSAKTAPTAPGPTPIPSSANKGRKGSTGPNSSSTSIASTGSVVTKPASKIKEKVGALFQNSVSRLSTDTKHQITKKDESKEAATLKKTATPDPTLTTKTPKVPDVTNNKREPPVKDVTANIIGSSSNKDDGTSSSATSKTTVPTKPTTNRSTMVASPPTVTQISMSIPLSSTTTTPSTSAVANKSLAATSKPATTKSSTTSVLVSSATTANHPSAVTTIRRRPEQLDEMKSSSNNNITTTTSKNNPLSLLTSAISGSNNSNNNNNNNNNKPPGTVIVGNNVANLSRNSTRSETSGVNQTMPSASDSNINQSVSARLTQFAGNSNGNNNANQQPQQQSSLDSGPPPSFQPKPLGARAVVTMEHPSPPSWRLTGRRVDRPVGLGGGGSNSPLGFLITSPPSSPLSFTSTAPPHLQPSSAPIATVTNNHHNIQHNFSSGGGQSSAYNLTQSPLATTTSTSSVVRNVHQAVPPGGHNKLSPSASSPTVAAAPQPSTSSTNNNNNNESSLSNKYNNHPSSSNIGKSASSYPIQNVVNSTTISQHPQHLGKSGRTGSVSDFSSVKSIWDSKNAGGNRGGNIKNNTGVSSASVVNVHQAVVGGSANPSPAMSASSTGFSGGTGGGSTSTTGQVPQPRQSKAAALLAHLRGTSFAASQPNVPDSVNRNIGRSGGPQQHTQHLQPTKKAGSESNLVIAETINPVKLKSSSRILIAHRQPLDQSVVSFPSHQSVVSFRNTTNPTVTLGVPSCNDEGVLLSSTTTTKSYSSSSSSSLTEQTNRRTTAVLYPSSESSSTSPSASAYELCPESFMPPESTTSSSSLLRFLSSTPASSTADNRRQEESMKKKEREIVDDIVIFGNQSGGGLHFENVSSICEDENTTITNERLIISATATVDNGWYDDDNNSDSLPLSSAVRHHRFPPQPSSSSQTFCSFKSVAESITPPTGAKTTRFGSTPSSITSGGSSDELNLNYSIVRNGEFNVGMHVDDQTRKNYSWASSADNRAEKNRTNKEYKENEEQQGWNEGETAEAEAAEAPILKYVMKRTESMSITSMSTSASSSRSSTPSSKGSVQSYHFPAHSVEVQVLVEKEEFTSQLTSFTPPYRPESESERKAQARKQRESRRSTQGVTMDQLRSAQQLSSTASAEQQSRKSSDPSSGTPEAPPRRPISTTAPLSPTSASVPPWRSQALESAAQPKPSGGGGVDHHHHHHRQIGSSSTALRPVQSSSGSPGLESASDPIPAAPSFASSIKGITNRAISVVNPSKIGDEGDVSDGLSSSTVTPPNNLKGTPTTPSSTPSANMYIKNRRSRQQRRSTGPVAQQDLENISDNGNNKQSSSSLTTPVDASNNNNNEIPTLHGPVPSTQRAVTTGVPRITPANSISGYRNAYPANGVTTRTPSAGSLVSPESQDDLNYKALYEKERKEREKLAERLKEMEDSMRDLKRPSSATESAKTKPPPLLGNGLPPRLAEIGKQVTLESRVNDLQEDTKEVDKLRADNQRLKEENGALIRVISKLSK